MAKKPLRIIAVGALKTAHWKSAAAHYVQRLQHWRQLHEVIVKDADAALPMIERNALEGQKILAQIQTSDIVICLDEKGKNYTSKEFSTFVQKVSENATRTPCFVVGGAFGLDAKVRDACTHLVALGPMTLPHELARVVLLEQLYRAEAILRKVPYHHE